MEVHGGTGVMGFGEKKCCEECILYKEKDLTLYIHLTHEWLQNLEKLTLLGKQRPLTHQLGGDVKSCQILM